MTSGTGPGWSGRPLPPGALSGVRVVDLSRQAPGPYASMLLADFGADVLIVEPPGGSTRGRETNIYWELERDERVSAFAALRRNKRSIELDLKDPSGRETMDQLIDQADVVLEGFRPGVADRLGVGAQQCLERNSALVHCSITGFGQHGPSAQMAGHDLNYLAASGVLHLVADRDGRPVIPLNLLADFGGGGLMAAFAVMVALYERERSGRGQSIDLAMLDGTFSLLTHAASIHLARGSDMAAGQFFLSGALPQYDTYRCHDDRWYAVGALEPWFYTQLMVVTGRPDLQDAYQDDTRGPEVRDHLTSWFGARSSGEVEAAIHGHEVCVNRVNTFEEALEVAESRGMLVPVQDGRLQIGVAPRLSRTPGSASGPVPRPGDDGPAVLTSLLHHSKDPSMRSNGPHTPSRPDMAGAFDDGHQPDRPSEAPVVDRHENAPAGGVKGSPTGGHGTRSTATATREADPQWSTRA